MSYIFTLQVSFVAKRGTQQDDEPDGALVVDLEKYSIPDGTRCVSDLIRVFERYCLVISWRVVSLSPHCLEE